MNIVELLREDHEEALQLIGELESVDEKIGTDPPDTEKFNKLHQALSLHNEVEGNFFYPIMEAFDEVKQLVEDAYQEHDRIDQLLSQLTTAAPNETAFQETLAELRNILEHHIEEAEGTLFPGAEELFEEVELEELGRQIEEIKSNSKNTLAADETPMNR
jgi:hemerythrin-like domain-containing protein